MDEVASQHDQAEPAGAEPAVRGASGGEERARFRLIPELVAHTGAEWPTRLGVILIGALVLMIFLWADDAGATDARFRAVRAAGFWPADLVDGDDGVAYGGYPVDVVFTLPFAWLYGSWPAVAGYIWLVFGGFSAAWLCGNWWGLPRAGTVCGAVYLLLCAPLVRAGDTATLAAFGLLPAMWGSTLRVAAHPSALRIGLAAAAGGALLSVSGSLLPAAACLWTVTTVASLRGAAPQRSLGALAAAVGGATLAAVPAMGIRNHEPALSPHGTAWLALPLFLVAAAALWVARRNTPRIALPIVVILAGLGPEHATPASILGALVLLPVLQRLLTQLVALLSRFAPRRVNT